MPEPPAAVLLATLGSEPQVIAIAAQLLLRQGALQRVIVLHTAPTSEPIASSLPVLTAIFTAQPSWPRLELVRLASHDVLTPQDIDQFAAALYRTLKRQLAQGRQVHLLLAGGRKPMAMVGMTVAQMLLGPEDRVWYLYSNEALRLSGRPFLQPHDDARLVAIPLPRLSAAPPAFTLPFQADSPSSALAALEAGQQQRLAHFVEHELTAAEREVAALFAQEVFTVQEVAERLYKSPRTVSNQLNAIYSKLESAFGLRPDRGVKREFLRRYLADHFTKDRR